MYDRGVPDGDGVEDVVLGDEAVEKLTIPHCVLGVDQGYAVAWGIGVQDSTRGDGGGRGPGGSGRGARYGHRGEILGLSGCELRRVVTTVLKMVRVTSDGV